MFRHHLFYGFALTMSFDLCPSASMRSAVGRREVVRIAEDDLPISIDLASLLRADQLSKSIARPDESPSSPLGRGQRSPGSGRRLGRTSSQGGTNEGLRPGQAVGHVGLGRRYVGDDERECSSWTAIRASPCAQIAAGHPPSRCTSGRGSRAPPDRAWFREMADHPLTPRHALGGATQPKVAVGLTRRWDRRS